MASTRRPQLPSVMSAASEPRLLATSVRGRGGTSGRASDPAFDELVEAVDQDVLGDTEFVLQFTEPNRCGRRISSRTISRVQRSPIDSSALVIEQFCPA